MWYFIIVLWLLRVRGDAQVTVSTTNTQLETTAGVTLIERKTTDLSTYNPTFTFIKEFTGLSHGISSGRVGIIGNNIFYIPDFHFDGKAPRAYFLVGKGDIILESGIKVPVTEASDDPLTEYDGQDIQLKLPDNVTVDDIDWLAVWCYDVHADLGHVYIQKVYPPQICCLEDEVTSGPIVLVNKKTLFVPDLRYKGGRQNVHFWVGNGTKPSSDGLMIPDESGSTDSLHSYQGENIYINLINDVSTDNIEYFGVWSIDEKLDLGHVILERKKEVPELNPKSTKALNFVMRLPKCCEPYSIMTNEGCGKRPSMKFSPDFKIFEHNKTHFNKASVDLRMFDFEPYYFSPDCKGAGKYFLVEKSAETNKSEDEYAILKNGSLLVKGPVVSGILSQRDFCVDNIPDDEKMKIFLCFTEPTQKVQQAMFVAYITLTFVSTFCFVGTFFLYCFWLKIEDIHRKCFTAYVLAMSITFLSLTIVQIGHVEGNGCKFLGFLFQFSMIAAFTLLAILCVDILVIVRYIDENKKKRKRKGWYLGIALGVPILFLIISLARNLTPDVPNSFFKPQYNYNYCNFKDESQSTAIFHVPISIALVVSIISLAATKLKIVEYDRYRSVDFFWIDKGTTYKFMWRKHFIICVTFVLWYAQSFIPVQTNATILVAVDLVEASQGIFVLLLFVANKETRTQILKNLKARRRTRNLHDTNGEEDYMLNTFKS